MDDIIVKIGLYVLSLLVPVVVGYVVAFLRRKLGAEKYSQLQTIASDAVHYVEQVYGASDNVKKFNYASDWLSEQAKKVGITLSAEQIEGLIESAVAQMKKSASGTA